MSHFLDNMSGWLVQLHVVNHGATRGRDGDSDGGRCRDNGLGEAGVLDCDWSLRETDGFWFDVC